ncbi:ABC transporter ATP-binding protein [Pseudoflavitalea rhizosphaerae]|uniref:ABC transporter ATP-binding protein n=1 Tax=Pseudoflavitalea rhizosphaerae TaxID=1884793 RepID=UPI000F8EA44D|nr:ABC transporter ATP-binding protein [Pseudoflavitalea rhizosphaerae]
MEKTYRNNFRGYFLFYYRIAGNSVLVFLLLSMLISLLDGIGLAMFIPLLQTVADPADKTMAGSNITRYFTDLIHWAGMPLNVTSILLAMVLLFWGKGLVRYLQMRYYARLRQLFIRKVRLSLVDSLQALPYSGFLSFDSGEIHHTLTVDVQRLFQTMKFYFDAAQSSVMLLTYMLLAFVSNFHFAVLVAIGAGLSNLLYRRIYKVTKKASVELSGKGSDFNGFINQATLYFKYLKSTNSFERYTKKLNTVIVETEQINRRIGNMNAITTAVKEPLIIVVVSLVILLQVNFMGASLTSILLSLLLFYRALNFLVTLQNNWQGFIENIGGMNAVALMMGKMQSLREQQGDRSFTGFNAGISLQDVSLAYQEKKVLRNINLFIPVKKTIALVGESGAGKTTLANVLAGLVQPDSGQVLIDDIPLTSYNLDSYRRRVGYISQETVIFNDTIFNNITFWDEPSPENRKRFFEVIKMTSLTQLVEAHPQKEAGILGDNGILISGGQKQRISIARELYRNTDILIFDEATSSLDSQTEKIIQENMENLYGRFTMVLIAHRLSTIRKADVIYLIENGEVVASGTFSEMLESSIRFRKLVSLQTFAL